jgi:hypothetical protein
VAEQLLDDIQRFLDDLDEHAGSRIPRAGMKGEA